MIPTAENGGVNAGVSGRSIKGQAGAWWRGVLVVIALLVVGLALLLTLVARRHTEAKSIADGNLIVRDIAGRLRYETMRQPRDVLQSLIDRTGSGGAVPAQKERLDALSAAGFHITITQRGQLAPVTTGRGSAGLSPVAPSLLALGATRYLAADGSGSYLFPAAWQDKILIGRILGGVSPTDIHAAIQVETADLLGAAQGVLLPGIEIAFFRNGISNVKIVREEGAKVHLDTTRASLPDEFWQDDSRAVDLSKALEWPRFLLFGGHEVSGFHVREEQRRNTAYHVVYLRDTAEAPDMGDGVELAYPSNGDAIVPPWKAGYVGAGMLAYLIACAVLLRLARLEKK